MNLRLTAFFLLIVCFIGCSSEDSSKPPEKQRLISKTIIGSWLLSDITANNGTQQPSTVKLLAEAKGSKALQTGIMLSFYPDGSFTEVKGAGNYRFGKWRYINKGKAISMTDSSSAEIAFVHQETVSDRSFLNLMYNSTHTEMKFTFQGEPVKDFKEDPFYNDNNTWRIKPAHSENTAALQERLGNYFRHLLYVLKSAKEKRPDAVSFAFSQGIVKIYNGGVGIERKTLVAESWKKTYYDYEEALMAYTMFDEYLTTARYKGAATGNWVYDDYNVLLGIYGDLKEGKFPAGKIESR